MAKTDAQDYYNQRAGDGSVGYVSAQDAKDAIGVTYDDLEVYADDAVSSHAASPTAHSQYMDIDQHALIDHGPIGGGGGTTDHSQLQNLAVGDDHPQYLNYTRGDTRYSQLSHSHGANTGHIIQDEGVSLSARSKLNFVGGGVVVVDDFGNDSTKVTIGSSGSVFIQPNEPVWGADIPSGFPLWLDTDDPGPDSTDIEDVKQAAADATDFADFQSRMAAL